MTKDELKAWALKNGWRMIGDYPCLARPHQPDNAIVRLVLKATVASIEFKKPNGKWEKVSGESYSKIIADPDTGIPSGLGITTIAGLTTLMQDNKDRNVFGKK
jgi:hypothetical protein